MDEVSTRRELLANGWSARRLTAAVADGTLLRLRNGHYASPDLDAEVRRAVTLGGRLACVSELRFRGVWLLRPPTTTHVQVRPNSARLRAVDRTTRHWHPQHDDGSSCHVGIVDALVRAADCLPRIAAITAIDSAINLGLVSRSRLALVAGEPVFAARLREADGAAQSGLESIVRVLARDLGFSVRAQVRFAGIGIADLVVEDWVVVETDGAGFHDDAPTRARDRVRDARHAAAGRTALRFRYAQVVDRPREVAAAIIGAVGAHRRIQNSGRLAARARSRAIRAGLA